MSQIKKPHLACDADLDSCTFPMMAFPKLDGVRGMNLLNDGFVGRSLKAHKNNHTTKHFSVDQLVGVDGELCAKMWQRKAIIAPEDKAELKLHRAMLKRTGKKNDDKKRIREDGTVLVPQFEEGSLPYRHHAYTATNSLCRDTASAVSRVEGEPVVWLHCFDLLSQFTLNLPYLQRYTALQELVKNLHDHYGADRARVEVIPFVWVQNKEQAQALYEEYLSQGYEGLILRNPNGLHKDGRCTQNEASYIRLKPTGDAEAVVVRIEEGETNLNEAKTNELGQTERSTHKENMHPSGMVGRLWCTINGGPEFKVSPGCLTHNERKYYFENPCDILQKVIKFKFFNHGAKDAYRMARFHSFRIPTDIGE